jgi:hypothetical protein
MTDLTEQWKKGELPDDEYYCRTTHNSSVCKHYLSNIDNENMIEILAQVPSYEELQNMNKAVNECMAANIKLVEQNAQLKEQINHLSKTQARQFVDNQKLQVKAEKAKDVVNIDTARQMKQLKELLKECRELFRLEQGYFIKCLHEEALSNIITKIDEVLK